VLPALLARAMKSVEEPQNPQICFGVADVGGGGVISEGRYCLNVAVLYRGVGQRKEPAFGMVALDLCGWSRGSSGAADWSDVWLFDLRHSVECMFLFEFFRSS
jgi:hypothetical protein